MSLSTTLAESLSAWVMAESVNKHADWQSLTFSSSRHGRWFRCLIVVVVMMVILRGGYGETEREKERARRGKAVECRRDVTSQSPAWWWRDSLAIQVLHGGRPTTPS